MKTDDLSEEHDQFFLSMESVASLDKQEHHQSIMNRNPPDAKPETKDLPLTETSIKYNLRPRDTRQLTKRYEDYEINFCEVKVPVTYEEAMLSPNKKHWEMAVKSELEALVRNGTWELTPLPPEKKAISSKWVFKIKTTPDNTYHRYKARLCAKGCAQIYDIDYKETFAPTVRYDSVRVLLAIAVQRQYTIKQFDVTTAFLYGDLTEEVFMKPPIGIDIKNGMFCKLKKSLYGLKQAPRCWHDTFSNYLREIGLESTDADKCVYKGQFGEETVLLLLYVDDGLIMCRSHAILKDILTKLQERFLITINLPSIFVGIQMVCNLTEGSILIHQKAYIDKILKEFNMSEAKSLSVPFDPNTQLICTNDEPDENLPYRSAVGSLMYASITTRPDITYSVGVLSRYLNKYNQTHWNAVKRVFRYLQDTKENGIKYIQNECDQICGYADSDFAGDLDTRRSTSGYIFMMSGGPVTWCSQRQATVSQSTTEAEYIAAASACREAVWLRQLLKDIDGQVTQPTIINIDNQSAIKLIRNPILHKRTKHIDIKYHYIREKYEENVIALKYLSTDQQLADMLTKPLPKAQFRKLISVMMFCK